MIHSTNGVFMNRELITIKRSWISSFEFIFKWLDMHIFLVLGLQGYSVVAFNDVSGVDIKNSTFACMLTC